MATFGRALIFIALLTSIVEGRILRLNSSDDELISDGADPPARESCTHQYGFLPCAENVAGYIFLIVVYQVLLIFGDKMIGSGSELLFSITGPKFGGILFRILRALPSMMFMILSGIFTNKEDAESQVSVVVGVYAGTIVFGLTLQWFLCMLYASKPLKKEESGEALKSKTQDSKSRWFPSIKDLRILTDNGVEVDEQTRNTAGIMLLSLIPYLVLQLIYVFSTWSGKRFMTLIALVVSSLSVILYFGYQIKDPWMNKRSLDYSNFDIVQRKFMQLVERLGNLLTEDGTPDVKVIKSFFDQVDKDDDGCVATKELEQLTTQLLKDGKTDSEQHDVINKFLSDFDHNMDKRITEEEFIQGFKKWVTGATCSASNSDNFNPKELFQKASQLLQGNNENKTPVIDKIMSKILKKAEGQLMKSEALITDDGEPNLERIKSLFKDFDSDSDGSLSRDELKKLICKVKFGTYNMQDDVVIKEIFSAFNTNDDKVLDETEFVNGMKEYVEKAIKSAHNSEKTKIIEEFDKIMWKEEHGLKDFILPILQVLLGIATLTFLGKPLMNNILELSHAWNFPSYIISFVAVPVAMNARAAIAALLPASKKREDTASLTFSEIYGGVIMINITGLTTLLAIVYAKELTWDFSAEVITILVVCGIIGFQAFMSKIYHLWTCIPAILLYPFSLGLFYFVQAFFQMD